MGRKSKLSDRQWEEIGKRLLPPHNEKAAALAKEFGVARSTINERFSGVVGKIKDVANQIVTTRLAVNSLPISGQIAAFNVADDVMSVMRNMAGGSVKSSSTYFRLAGIAHGLVDMIDDAEPLSGESLEAIKKVAAITKAANEAAQVPLAMLAANKDLNKPKEDDDREYRVVNLLDE